MSGTALNSAFAALTPKAPLAWNNDLSDAARAHSQAMITANLQSHQVPGESDLLTRIRAQGYNDANGMGVGENIFATAKSPLHAHAGFMVDWGSGPNGMQSPPGHRNNIMSASFREIGIGIIEKTASGNTGPQVVTEDFGYRQNAGQFVVGVAYNDTNKDNFYSVGEGLGTLVTKVGAAAPVTSWASGGYSIETAATGAQTVTFTGAGLASAVSVALSLASKSSVKLDIVNGNTLKTSTSVTVTGPISNLIGLGLTGLTLNAVSSNAHTITGTSGNDTLGGGSGNDVLDGALGNDRMTGGLGNDTYRIGTTSDVVVEAANGGTDTVQSFITLTLATNLENLILMGGNAINGTGNAVANFLRGDNNSAANTLTGLAGNDTYDVGTGDKIVEAANAGTDIVQSSTLSLNLASFANVENITLNGTTATSATGSSVANLIKGETNSAANTLTGLTGNDIYIVGAGDKIVETATGGTDMVQSSTVSINLASYANVENITLNGTATLSVVGSAVANTIIGNSGSNAVSGLAGVDVLNGALGNDTLTGGTEGDFFVFNSALNASTNRDTITDFASIDTIRLENAIFTAFAAVAANTAISAASFWSAAGAVTAHDLDDRIIYNATNGALYYDADGNQAGGVAAVQFAILTTHPGLTNADFLII